MRVSYAVSLAGLLVCSGVAQAQQVLAECGASEGHAYYLTPRDQGWVDDPTTGGRVRFTMDGAGNPNIIFVDAGGRPIDAAADGGRLIFSRLDQAQREFGVVLIYPSTGVVETYNVYNVGNGRRRLLWTSNKPRIGSIGLTKVGAYTAECQ